MSDKETIRKKVQSLRFELGEQRDINLDELIAFIDAMPENNEENQDKFTNSEVVMLLKKKGFDGKTLTRNEIVQWLRERPRIAYNINVWADGCLGCLHWIYEIQEIDNELLQCNGSLDAPEANYDTFEEACDAAIERCVKYFI